jgi:hypothetical protein
MHGGNVFLFQVDNNEDQNHEGRKMNTSQAELNQRISDYQNEMLNFFFMYEDREDDRQLMDMGDSNGGEE